jgi:hypothetical protein
MFIARWQFTAHSGKLDQCLSLLRQWEIDVGTNIGWRPGSIRIVTGFIGAAEGEVEFETHFDELDDLQSAWKSMAKHEGHKAFTKKLEPLMISGTSRWNIYRKAELVPQTSSS